MKGRILLPNGKVFHPDVHFISDKMVHLKFDEETRDDIGDYFLETFTTNNSLEDMKQWEMTHRNQNYSLEYPELKQINRTEMTFAVRKKNPALEND